MGPLARRSPGRLLRSGVWGLLVGGAFLLLGAAASSAPFYAEASRNAALTNRVAAVPATAAAGEAAVVRIVGGAGSADRLQAGAGLEGISGLTRNPGTASSIGVESRPRELLFTPYVGVGTKQPAPSRETGGGRLPDGVQRARIFGDDDLARSLVPVPGSPAPVQPAAGSSGPPAVWVPAPLARELDLVAGEPITVGVQ